MVRIALLHNRNRGTLLQSHHQLMRRTALHLHATNHIILPEQLTHLLLIDASERNAAQRLELLLHLGGFQQGCAAHRNLLSRQQGREEDQHHIQHRDNSQCRSGVQQLTGTSQRRTLLTGAFLSTQAVQARILTQTLTVSLTARTLALLLNLRCTLLLPLGTPTTKTTRGARLFNSLLPRLISTLGVGLVRILSGRIFTRAGSIRLGRCLGGGGRRLLVSALIAILAGTLLSLRGCSLSRGALGG